MNTVSKFFFAIMLTIGCVNLNAGDDMIITFKTSGVRLPKNFLTIKPADFTEGKTWATLIKEQLGSFDFQVVIEQQIFNLDQSITQDHVNMIKSSSTIAIAQATPAQTIGGGASAAAAADDMQEQPLTKDQKTTRKKSKFVDMYYDATTTEAQAQAQAAQRAKIQSYLLRGAKATAAVIAGVAFVKSGLAQKSFNWIASTLTSLNKMIQFKRNIVLVNVPAART